MEESEERLLTPKEVANILGVTQDTVRGWIKAGKLGAIKLAGKLIRIKQSELDRFIREGQISLGRESSKAPGEPDLLTVREAACYLRVRKDTLYKWLREGKIPHIKINRHIRVARTALDKFILEGTTRGKDAG